jgi:hypothetical protein
MSLALGGLALTPLCVSSLSQAAAASKARSPAAKLHSEFEGVWEAVGGAMFDPAARNLPDNRDRSTSEMRETPPYNAEYEARYSKIIADVRKGVAVDDGSARCLPQGMPRMMVINYPIDIIVQPKRVVMLFEPLAQRRIIYTDGRKHTDLADLDPSFSGESIGYWEGNVLVVDTIGLREDTVFDVSVAPHSDALHIRERMRRVGENLEIHYVVEDPKAFTKPWYITRVYKRNPGWELREFVCENNRTE